MTAQQSAQERAIALNKILPRSQFIGLTDEHAVRVQSCCSQWDEIEVDDLYVAIVEPDADGHDYAREAIERGAAAVVTERLLSVPAPQCIVPDTREAFGQICHALAGRPSEKFHTVGVAGSDGKTVTSHLIRSIFQQNQKTVGLLSTIESDLGLRSEAAPGPMGPAGLADRLSNMVLGGCEHAVIEMPSIGLAKRSFAGTQLDAAVLTNLRQDHLGFHGSSANYRRAKTRILNYLKPTGFAVLNADDPTSLQLLDELDCPTLTIGMKQTAEVTGKVIERTASEQTFLIMAGNESAAVQTSIIGDQHIYNSLAAAAVALTAGVNLATIAAGIQTVASIPGRLERVECGQEFGVWIESARSSRQLATALNSIRKVTSGKIWCVCSTSDSQTPLERRRMGEIVERAAHRSVITRSSVSKQVDFEPSHQVLDGFDRPAKAQVIPDRIRAIEWTLAQCQPGDAVVVTGAGERAIATVGEKDWSITDRDVCQAWLYDRGRTQPVADDTPPKIFNINDFR